MKKRVSIIALAMAMVLTLLLCAGCGAKLKTVNQQYPETSNASQATQTIIICSKGGLTQYERVRSYSKTASGYDWTQTEKTLNTLDSVSDEPYNERTRNGSVSYADFAPALKLDDKSLFSESRTRKGVLTLTVAEGNERTVLSSDNMPTEVSNLVLTFAVKKKQVNQMTINFDSENSHVAITVDFAY